MSRDPYKYFRIEAKELLAELGRSALDLEKPERRVEAMSALLRAAHTLKGAARVVKERSIADHAHAIEEALGPFREGDERPPRTLIDELLRRVDASGERLAGLDAPGEAAPQKQPGAKAEEPLRTVRTDVAEVDQVLEGLAGAHAETAAIRRSLALVERGRRELDRLSRRMESSRDRERARTGDGIDEAGGAERGAAQEIFEVLATLEREIQSSSDRIDRELSQTRDLVERMRLVPAEALFNALERVARDAATAQGKRVTMEAKGGGVRIDAHILGIVERALGQVVRNAVAHGIELEDVRRAAGKSPEGRIVVEVERRGGQVAFTCTDDGRGVDLEAVRRAAERKGLLTREARALGAVPLLRLLLRGGISTQGVVTEIAGRGIGLDLARNAAERLGGRIDVRTTEGRGTSVEIVVPLSLSSIDALIVVADEDAIAIPLHAVRHAGRVSPSDVMRTASGAAVRFEERLVPFLPLSALLGPKGPSRYEPRVVVIVEHQEAFAALGVDRLAGTGNIVLRPLPLFASASEVVAGTSLDAEGNPRLVLDPSGVVARAAEASASQSHEGVKRKTVLVVDDSLTTRMLEQSILESAGYDVDLAASAEEGLEKALRDPKHALFLVDVEMPGMDGFTFVERASNDPALRHVPAILVTSRASPDDLRRGREAGAKDYVIKSEFDQVKLLARIRELVA